MTPPRMNSHRRQGLVSVTLLVGLIIVGLVAASLLKVGMARRGAAKSAEHQQQAELLVASALDRALVRFDADPKYPGDVWEIPAEELSGRGSARVTTEIGPSTDPPGGRSLTVSVEYRAATPQPIRLTRSIRLPLPPIAR